MVRVTFTIDPTTLNTIDAIAAATGAAKSEIIRRGVAAYLKELGARGLSIETEPAHKKKTAPKRRK